MAEVARDLSEGGYEQVSEVVAFEAVAGAKPVRKEPGKQVALLADGDHAVAQVARREHVEILAQSAGRTAVVSDGDDSRQVRNLAATRQALRWRCHMQAQATQQRGKAGTAANGGNAQRPHNSGKFPIFR